MSMDWQFSFQGQKYSVADDGDDGNAMLAALALLPLEQSSQNSEGRAMPVPVQHAPTHLAISYLF
jgi:hypothetical protein